MRRVEDITEALWGTRVSFGTVSQLNQNDLPAHRDVAQPQDRRRFPVRVPGRSDPQVKRSWEEEVRNVSVLVAIEVGADGHRQILGVVEGQKDLDEWRGFLRYLKERGLAGVQLLIISDACFGLVEAAAEFFPEAQWQRCVCISIATCSATSLIGKLVEVARMLKAIHTQQDRRAAEDKVREVLPKLKAMRLAKAAELVARYTDVLRVPEQSLAPDQDQ